MSAIRSVCFAVLLAVFTAGCGGPGSNPLAPAPGEGGTSSLAMTQRADAATDHSLLGAWRLAFDLKQLSAKVVEDRQALAHFDITEFLIPPFCGDCLQIEIISNDPVEHLLTFRATLKNPFPKLSGYNVRGIIVSDDPNHDLANADGYTKLWDDHEPKHINPFVGFPQPTGDDPYPLFEGGATHAREFLLTYGDPPGFILIDYRVDASFPGPPEEPALITNIRTEGHMYPSGGYQTVSLSVFDAQDDVNSVLINATPFVGGPLPFEEQPDGVSYVVEVPNELGAPEGEYRCKIKATSDGSGDLAMYHYVTLSVKEPPPVACFEIPSPEPPYWAGDPITFDASCSSGQISAYRWDWGFGDQTVETNPITEHAFPKLGVYQVALTASGPGGESEPFQLDVHVRGELNGIEVTPPWLNFSPYDLCVLGNFAFVAAYHNGLVIFEVSDPADPRWVNKIETPGPAVDVVVSNGYAYVPCEYAGLCIIDVHAVMFAQVVSVIETGAACYSVDVADGYAYATDTSTSNYGFLHIISVDPPESAYIIHSVDLGSEQARAIDVADGYAYVVADIDFGWNAFLQIVDVDPPGSASLVYSLYLGSHDPSANHDVRVQDGYAYVGLAYYGDFTVVDVDPPVGAHAVSTHHAYVQDLFVSDGYAYAVGNFWGINVYDVSNPEEAFLADTIEGSPIMTGISCSEGHLFLAHDCFLQAIAYEPLSPPEVASTALTPGQNMVAIEVAGDTAYLSTLCGLQVWDVSEPEDPTATDCFYQELVGGELVSFGGKGWTLRGDYAYLAQEDFVVLDMSNPASPSIIRQAPTEDYPSVMIVQGDYAYLGEFLGRLEIVDIEPPEEAGVVASVDAVMPVWDLDVGAGYAYIVSGEQYSGLQIYDVDPPEDAHFVGTFGSEHEYLSGVAVHGDYGYLTGYDTDLLVLDLHNPAAPEIVCTVEGAYGRSRITIHGNLAFLHSAGSPPTTMILDIGQPDQPYICGMLANVPYAQQIELSDDGSHAFADTEHGMRVFRLE